MWGTAVRGSSEESRNEIGLTGPEQAKRLHSGCNTARQPSASTSLNPPGLPRLCLNSSSPALAAGAEVQAISRDLLLVLLQQQGWEGLAELHAQAQACSQELAAACGLPGPPALADAHAQRLLDSCAQVLAQGGMAGKLIVEGGPDFRSGAWRQLMFLCSRPATCGDWIGWRQEDDPPTWRWSLHLVLVHHQRVELSDSL